MEGYFIGIDLGGTHIKAVALNTHGEILYSNSLLTHDGEEQVWKQSVKQLIDEVRDQFNVQEQAIGISAPGLPNDENTCIACMPGRMEGLENFDWPSFLNTPVKVMNDAVAALVGEATFGVAKNKKHVVMLTLGTGVGGAILIDGKPYLGAFSKAGHIGHMVVNEDGKPDVTGMPGSLEMCIGNCTLSDRSGGAYKDTFDLIKDYRRQDAYATSLWLTSVRQLSIAISSLINILSPQQIILGGGITEAGDDLFIPLADFMEQYEWCISNTSVPIVKASLGNSAGAIGAACFAMQNMK